MLAVRKKYRALKAVIEGDVGKLRKLLDEGVDPNVVTVYDRWDDDTFVYHSLRYGKNNKFEIISLLIERGTKVKQNNIEKAVDCGQYSLVELMLATNPSLINDGSLVHAATHKNIKFAEILLEKGVSLDSNALHIAAQLRCKEMVSLLLKNGADPNRRDGNGKTALFYAKENKHEEIEAILSPLTEKVVLLPPQSEAGWKLLTPEEIARISFKTAIGYRVTEVFNFRAGEYIRILQNIETKAETMETSGLSDIRNHEALHEAEAELRRLGGTGGLKTMRFK